MLGESRRTMEISDAEDVFVGEPEARSGPSLRRRHVVIARRSRLSDMIESEGARQTNRVFGVLSLIYQAQFHKPGD